MSLITISGSNESELLDGILSDEIIVLEDIQGSKIWVNWGSNSVEIKPKSLSNDSINMVDLTMQNYYNPAYNYLSNLDSRIKSLLNKKWWFCFEYFFDNQPANIKYDRMPTNGLVLTAINKNGKYDFNIDEIEEYARLLVVDPTPVVFQGRMTEKMKEAIKYFINTSEEDLDYVFGEKSFTYFFYKMLNPSAENSFMMNGDFQKNIEKLVIKTKNGDYAFQLLNPLYSRINLDNNTEFVEIYTLILINFLNFCQSINLDNIKMKGRTKEELYIYLITKIFNIYVSEVKDDLIGFEFEIPVFFDKDKFKINKELIPNKLTKEYIEEYPKLEYIFKVILGSFNKQKKKPIGLFTDNTLILFNSFVSKINDYIEMNLGRVREIELNRSGLLDFGDFFDIKYDMDADDKVYPDVYTEFEKDRVVSKKKKMGLKDLKK
jgi:hypothetical protein